MRRLKLRFAEGAGAVLFRGRDGVVIRAWLEDVETGEEVRSGEVKRLFARLEGTGMAVKQKLGILPGPSLDWPYFAIVEDITDAAVTLYDDFAERRVSISRNVFHDFYELD